MHHLFPCTVGETLVFLQKKTRSTLQIFSVDDSLTSRLGKYSFVKQIATYVDTIGTIQNVPYKNIQLQISVIPKSNNRKLQLSPTDSAFPHNCNMFGCYCLYLGPFARICTAN